jgi:hypothetical protein
MPNQPKTPARSVRVPEDLWQAALVRSQEKGETVTDVLVRALRDYTRCENDAEAERRGAEKGFDEGFMTAQDWRLSGPPARNPYRLKQT